MMAIVIINNWYIKTSLHFLKEKLITRNRLYYKWRSEWYDERTNGPDST